MIRQLIFIGLLLIGFVGNSYSQDYIDEHTVNGLSASHKYTYDYFIRAIGSEPDSLTGDGYLSPFIICVNRVCGLWKRWKLAILFSS